MCEAKLYRFSIKDEPVIQKSVLHDDAFRFLSKQKLILETSKGMFEHTIYPEYLSNCLSTPRLIHRWLPSYNPNNPLYNACGFWHDNAYEKKGFGILSIEDCDDIFRGMLRCAGVDRMWGGLADKFLIFAHTKRHWGANEYGNKNELSSWVRI